MSYDACPINVEQTIPDSDITPFELAILEKLFDAQRHQDGWNFYHDEGSGGYLCLEPEEVQEIIELDGIEEYPELKKELEGAGDDEFETDNIEDAKIFQNIVKRPKTLTYISIEGCNYSSRPSGCGGFASFVTADKIEHMGTYGWLHEMKEAHETKVKEPT